MDNQDTALELASTVISWSGYLLAAIGVLLTISAIVFFFGVQPRIVRKETREYLQSEQGQKLLREVSKDVINGQLANVNQDKGEPFHEKY